MTGSSRATTAAPRTGPSQLLVDLVLDPRDPYPHGYTVGDIWAPTTPRTPTAGDR